MDNCRDLKQRFEERGIETTSPPPSQMLEGLKHDFGLLLAGAADEIVDHARRKAETAATTTARVDAYSKAALNLATLQREYGSHASLDRARHCVQEAVQTAGRRRRSPPAGGRGRGCP
jgi:hypothetical protein